MVDKRLKYLLYFLMIISLFLSIKNKVNAADYNLYSGSIQPSLCRAWYSSGVLDGGYSNGKCNFNTNINSIKQIGIFFDTKTYYGYKNYFYEFSGSLQSYGANVVVVNSYIANGSNVLIGSCDTTLNSTGQMTTFTSRCFIPSGLISGANKNIFFLYVADSGVTPTSAFNVEITLNDRYVLFENYYFDKNGGSSSITNAINNQSLQQHQDAQNTQNKIEETNNTLKDSSTDNQNAQNTFDSLNSSMATNSVISDLLLMPIHLLQKILNGLQGSCSAINTGQLFGEDFVLPCINPSDVIGTALWNIIDVICSGFLAYHIGKRFVVIFNQFTNLKEGGLEMAYD